MAPRPPSPPRRRRVAERGHTAALRDAQQALGQDITLGNADSSAALPLPTVLVIDAQRIVRFVDVQPDYTSRTEVSEILSALAGLTS